MIPGPNYTQRFPQVEETPLAPSCHVPGLSLCFLHGLMPTFLSFYKYLLSVLWDGHRSTFLSNLFPRNLIWLHVYRHSEEPIPCDT